MVTVAQATSVVSPGDADKDTPDSGLFRAVGISRAEVQSQEPTRGLHLPHDFTFTRCMVENRM